MKIVADPERRAWRPRRKAPPALTPGGKRYLEAEERWARFLRAKRRGAHRSMHADGRNSGRDVLDLVKAKAGRDLANARARRARRAHTVGAEATRLGVYTAEQVQKLGEMDPPKALKMPNGTYAYPIVNVHPDLHNALQAYKSAPDDKKPAGLRAWIIARAVALKAVEQLPTGWATPKVKLHPNELERDPSAAAGGTAKPGGPIQ